MKALITGAANGLGRALLEQLLDDGHEVIAVDIMTEDLDRLAVQSRGACRVVMADMANVTSIERCLRSLREDKLDLVILNAGISATGKFEEIPLGAYERLIHINLTAPLTMAAGLVGQGLMQRKGRIVFVSSLSHVVGYPGASVYAATKDAIAIYARSIAKPFRKSGVGVTTVFPGPIRTEHAQRHAPKGAKENKRMEPKELARMILKAAKRGKKELYPGSAAGMARLAGYLFPNFMTRMMRRIIFDKLDGNTY